MDKTKDKILLFLKLPPPLTGATLMNSYVAESSLLQDSYDCRLIPVSYKTKIEDIRVFSFRKIITLVGLYVKLIRALAGFKPRLVYFQVSPLGWAFYRDCTFIFIMKLFRVQRVYHMHGKGIKETVSGSAFRKRIYQWAFTGSAVICLSESLIADIESIYKGKPYVLNNAIPNLQETFPERNLQPDKLRILFLSNLIISKGIFVFLNAITLFKKKHSDFEAIIVGKQAEITSEQLESEIKERNLEENVHYLGAKYDAEKNEIYKYSDILVYPSYNDLWGLVILEAMQYGLPVIASKEGAIPEIVENEITGFLVDKHKPEQIVEKLENLYANPQMRKNMGFAGRDKFLRKYTLDIFERNLNSIFESILHNN